MHLTLVVIDHIHAMTVWRTYREKPLSNTADQSHTAIIACRQPFRSAGCCPSACMQACKGFDISMCDVITVSAINMYLDLVEGGVAFPYCCQNKPS